MTSFRELSGWVLSIYPDQVDGAVVWLLGQDGQRQRLTEAFATSFYATGELFRLQTLRTYLQDGQHPPKLRYTQRQHLYKGTLPVLEIKVHNPVAQERLFFHIKRQFKHLRYFDARIPFSIRYCAARGVFPMGKCRVVVDHNNHIQHIQALDSPWDLESDLPPIREMRIEPDTDPTHALPQRLSVSTQGETSILRLDDEIALLQQLIALIDTHDPDLILAWWGDSWLFPYLINIAEKHNIAFNPNRDEHQQVLHKEELTYESYGDIHYRAAQTHLFGRWHLDPINTTMDRGFNIQAAIEVARVTSVEVQTAARNSPGSGFTAMQIREALRRGVLVPMHKRQIEKFKTGMDLNLADCGGLNYRPVAGLHRHVAELDFFSMYPSIMAAWNISGETVGVDGERTLYVPQTGVPITQDTPGLVASILQPLLAKRRAAKKKLAVLDQDDPRHIHFKAVADGLKWLGYVSFGYQGFKNNLFGNIAAHEAITAIGREMLTRAKEAAHDMGFDVLGANTDNVFVRKPGASKPKDFQPLIDEIKRRTGLIIELEGIFDWLAFLPSKLNPMIGVTNRYFGKFADGGLKVRGLAQRRADAPIWIAEAEREIMEKFAESTWNLEEHLPAAIEITRRHFAELDNQQIPLVNLVIKKKLTRELHEYTNPAEAAKAAKQLIAAGKEVRVGQRIRFIYTHGEKTSVIAWGLPEELAYSSVNKPRYKELLLRTVHQIVQIFGISEKELQGLVERNTKQLPLWQEAGKETLRKKTSSLADRLFAPYLPK